MSTEPKPYLLPKLGDIYRGAWQGTLMGLCIGVWSLALSMIAALVWTDFLPQGKRLHLDDAIGTILSCATFSALFGVVCGACIGFFSGACTYLVLYPLVPPERWPQMDAALCAGMKKGAVIAQVVSVLSAGLVYGPWDKGIVGWLIPRPDGELIISTVWCALVPCGFMLGGFVSVARLMSWRNPPE